MPIWIAALIGYKMKLYGRETLKPFGIKLFIGGRFSHEKAGELAREYTRNLADHDGFLPGALAQIAADKSAGSRLILLTAAPEFYAQTIADHLGFDDCLATLHQRTKNGGWRAKLAGKNNYGAEKERRIKAWLAAQNLVRADCFIRFYSDHASDKPLFDYSDAPLFIGEAPGGSDWPYADWR